MRVSLDCGADRRHGGAWLARWRGPRRKTAVAATSTASSNCFADVLARVEQDYVTEINDEEAMEAAIQGMLASLDPHSSYMNATTTAKCKPRPAASTAGSALKSPAKTAL
jgi:C-terminal processing protease CtpA/Prc